MSHIGTLLRGLRLGKQLDLASMASALGTTPRQLELVEAGALFPPAVQRRDWAKLLGFSDLIDFDLQWRDGWTRMRLVCQDGLVPVINKAPAGLPTDYQEFGIDSSIGYEYVPRPQGMDGEILFAVVIIGNSMFPAFQGGDLVIFRPVRPDEPVPDGSPVFVRFTAERDHACTFKSLWKRTDGRLELRPENKAYAAMIVTSEEIDRMALAVQRRPKFCAPHGQSRVRDEYAQEFPEE